MNMVIMTSTLEILKFFKRKNIIRMMKAEQYGIKNLMNLGKNIQLLWINQI